MKFLFAFVVLFVAVQVNGLTDKQKELLTKHYKECVEKSHVDKAVIDKARIGQFTDDAKLKDHILCVSQKCGFENEAGVLKKDVILKKLKEAINGNDAQAQELVKVCAIANSDKKLQAFNAFKCFFQKANINLL